MQASKNNPRARHGTQSNTTYLLLQYRGRKLSRRFLHDEATYNEIQKSFR